jgi:hypothetical protein
MSLAGTACGDNWMVNDLCVLDSPNSEPLTNQSGLVGGGQNGSGPALTVSRSENERGWSSQSWKKGERKRE